MLIREEMINGSFFHQLLGYGFGRLLDLQLSIKLAGSTYDSIGTFHNGYYFIWYKTGFFGFLSLIFFLFTILLKSKEIIDKSLKKLLVGVLVSMAFQMYASMGIFSRRAYAFIILFLGFFISETISNERGRI